MDELEIATQIRDMIQSQNQLYMAQARIMRGQLAMMEAMAANMPNLDVTQFNSQLQEATDQLNAAEAAMASLGTTGTNAMGGLTTGTNAAGAAANSLGTALINAGNAAVTFSTGTIIMNGFWKGIQTAFESLVSVGNIVGTITEQLANLGNVILGAVIGPFSYLFDFAQKVGAGSGELRKAYEEVRKTFGSLATNEGAAVISMFKGLGRELGDTGLRTRRILGPPAEQLRNILGLSKAFGVQFDMVMNEGLIENAGNVMAFKKALDLSDESMKTASRVAATSGRTIDEVLREGANYAIQLGEAFHMSSMVISRGMQEMENDMKHFGGLSKKTLAETTVYATKLGIEVKSLAGIMDAFDNFDDAADAAARLNQQFGIQIDALEMLREEDPARRADMLRDSLNAAGVSYTNLDRRSKSYLANQLKISEAEAELLFNEKNRGLSLDQIKKKSGEAEKKQLTQVEVMHKLADAIERMVQAGGAMEGGIFSNFFKGFTEGIINSREFRVIIREIVQIFRMAIRYGRELGRAFVDLFPGIKGILGGFEDLFNPNRWRMFFRGIVDAFKSFFKTVQTDPEAGLRTLFQRLQDIFFNHFDLSKSGGSKLLSGFKTFYTTIFKTVTAAIRIILPTILGALRDGLRFINDILNGRGGGIGFDFQGMWNEIKTAIGEVFSEFSTFVSTTLTKYGPDILEGFTSVLTTVFNAIVPWLKENWKTVVLAIGAFFAGPALVGAIASGIGAMFTDVLASVGGGALLGGGGGGGGGGSASSAASAAAGTNSVISSVGSVASNATSWKEILAGSAGTIGIIITAVNEMQNLFKSIFEFAQKIQTSGISLESIGGSLLIIGGGALVVGALISMLSNIDVASLGSLSGLLGGGILVGITALLSGPVLLSFGNALLTFAGPNGPLDAIIGGVSKIATLMDTMPNFGEAVNLFTTLMSALGELAIGMAAIAASGALGSMASGATALMDQVRSLLPGGAPATPAAAPPSNPLTSALDGISTIVSIIADKLPVLIASTDGIAGLSPEEIQPRLNVLNFIANLIKENFVPTIVELKDAATTTIGALPTGGTTTVDFSNIGTFIDTMLSGIGNLLITIIENTRNLRPETITALSGLGPILQGAATVIATVGTTVSDMLKQTAGSGAAASGAGAFAIAFDPAPFATIFDTIGIFLNEIFNSASIFSGMPEDQIRAIGTTIGGITEAVFGVINQLIATLFNPQILELVGRAGSAAPLTILQTFISDITSTIFDPNGSVLSSIKGLITDIAALNLKPEQATVIQAVAGLITSLIGGMSDLIGAVANVADLGTQADEELPGGTIPITPLQDLAMNIGTIFGALQTLIPDMVKNINDAFKGVYTNTLNARVDSINGIIALLKTTLDFSKSLDEFNREASGQGNTVSPSGLTRIYELFSGTPNLFDIIRIVVENVKTISTRGIPNLKGISDAIGSLSEIGTTISGMTELTTINVETITNFVRNNLAPNINRIIEGMKTFAGGDVGGANLRFLNAFNEGFGPSMVAATEHLQNIANNLIPVAEGITDGLRERILQLTSTIGDTVTAINGIGSVDLSTTLEALENNLGLGGNASYTINNENFNLTINMKVVIDAGRFESVFHKRSQEQTNDLRFLESTFRNTTPTRTPGEGG